MNPGYVTTFCYLQFVLVALTEYVCRDGHRVHCHTVSVDYQDPKLVWC